MSGFSASNSRIRVVETINSIDETVFDTNDDMPHIIGTAYTQNNTVDFNNLTETRAYIGQECVGEVIETWTFTFTPGFFTYSRTTLSGTYNSPSYYPSYTSGSYTPGTWQQTTTYNPSTYERDPVTYSFDPCSYTVASYLYNVDAEETSTIVNIANLPSDEDGNAVDVDFVIVQATGSRTTNGKDPRFDQALPSAVPVKTFSFQGSILLESSGKANGDSWLRRIMSVYPSGGKLKLKIQESAGQLTRGANDQAFPHIAESRSTYNFNFKVFFGRFKS